MKMSAPHKDVMRITGFETLLIGVSLFVPIVGIPVTGIGEGARNAILAAFLESVPLLMALKIMVRKQAHRKFALAAILLLPLLLVGVRGLWDREGGAPFHLSVVPPAAHSAPPFTPPVEGKTR
jgi:hypothetical protein